MITYRKFEPQYDPIDENATPLERAIIHIKRSIDYARFAAGCDVQVAEFALVDIESLETLLEEVERLKTECGSK